MKRLGLTAGSVLALILVGCAALPAAPDVAFFHDSTRTGIDLTANGTTEALLGDVIYNGSNRDFSIINISADSGPGLEIVEVAVTDSDNALGTLAYPLTEIWPELQAVWDSRQEVSGATLPKFSQLSFAFHVRAMEGASDDDRYLRNVTVELLDSHGNRFLNVVAEPAVRCIAFDPSSISPESPCYTE